MLTLKTNLQQNEHLYLKKKQSTNSQVSTTAIIQKNSALTLFTRI